jgi:type IX secretion system PorP/SprF family membrane protein
MIRLLQLFYFIIILSDFSYSQDPHFTQFNAAPITINPNYVGVFDGKVRVTSNHRQQWSNALDPFVTSTLGVDLRINTSASDDNLQNPLNIGVFVMSDRSMKSAFKSDNISGAISYHVTLDNDGYISIGAALFASYSNRRIDFSSLSFDAQFASNGFNLQLPSGETSLISLKPFSTIGTGILYLYNNPDVGSFFDIGLSAYNLNQPKQTFLSDTNSRLPRRLSGHISYQKYFDEMSYISTKAIFQQQGNTSYILGGVTYGRSFGEDNKFLVGMGLWYRTGSAFSPQLIVEMKKFQLGYSYDIELGSMKNAPKPAKSMEFSLQWRFGATQPRY